MKDANKYDTKIPSLEEVMEFIKAKESIELKQALGWNISTKDIHRSACIFLEQFKSKHLIN